MLVPETKRASQGRRRKEKEEQRRACKRTEKNTALEVCLQHVIIVKFVIVLENMPPDFGVVNPSHKVLTLPANQFPRKSKQSHDQSHSRECTHQESVWGKHTHTHATQAQQTTTMLAHLVTR